MLPEVYCRKAISEPEMRLELESWPGRCAKSATCAAVVTRRSEGTNGSSSRATRSARANVMIVLTSALRRMAAWRAAYSSIRSARTGG